MRESSSTKVFEESGTLWENYAPEYAGHSNPAQSDFVGQTGVSAIAILIEYVIGLRPDLANNTLNWRVHLTERHGVHRYPFGLDGMLDLICDARAQDDVASTLRVTTDVPFLLTMHWHHRTSTWNVAPGTHILQL